MQRNRKKKDFNKKFKNFVEAWAYLKSLTTKYQCREPEIPIKQTFSKKDKFLYVI